MSVELLLKVTPGASETAIRGIRVAAQELGARQMRRMFPGRDDAARRSLYVIDLDDKSDPTSVSASLRRHDAVEAVEPAFERELA